MGGLILVSDSMLLLLLSCLDRGFFRANFGGGVCVMVCVCVCKKGWIQNRFIEGEAP